MIAIKKMLPRHTKGILLYIDLDKFKPVNDTFGHEAGDEILAQTAERLRLTLPEDALITRMGGDEFCAFVSDAQPEKGAELAQKLKARLDKPYKLKAVKERISVGASIGHAAYPTDGQTPTDLISTADKGMYGVKHSGA